MSSGRILVVDDESQILRVSDATLTAQGYEIQAAVMRGRVGADARAGFDLLMLEMNHSTVRRLSTCREISATSEVPLSGSPVRAIPNRKSAALGRAPTDYITKPSATPECSARIRADAPSAWPATADARATIGFARKTEP